MYGHDFVLMSMHETDHQTRSRPEQSEHLPSTEVRPRLRLGSTCLRQRQCVDHLDCRLHQPASARDEASLCISTRFAFDKRVMQLAYSSSSDTFLQRLNTTYTAS